MDNFEASAADHPEAVAVIGMAGRFPGAGDVEQFWRNLRDGVESITFFSDDELRAEGVAASLLKDPHYVKARGILQGADLFDAAFFGFTPREAEAMAPQHRLALECAWHALENAGYDPGRCKGRVGVYAGLNQNSYLMRNLMANPAFLAAAGGMQISIQNRNDHLAPRISYKLDLRGPSLNVQTACSTSLTAVHLACQSLLNYQCEMALAGGVSVHLPLRGGYLRGEGDILSPDGHCRPFDAEAQGTLAGDGVAMVVLKRLEDALADRDQVLAVIRGSAVNNDGAEKAGYTAPGVRGQAEVIAEALAVAGVDPSTVSYVEAHGTATPLGDPIEVEALTEVFSANTDRKGFCALGAVKSNLGHLDAAAGVAGLIKTVLALKHRQIPPILHYRKPNPQIDFASTPFYPAERLTPWPGGNGNPRRAGVSSFGFGGTNVHLVLEEAPKPPPASSGRDWKLLLLSARNSAALEESTVNLSRRLMESPELNLDDVAYTLQAGRKAFARRRAVLCRHREEAVELLGSLDFQSVFTTSGEARPRPVAFLFPGQGAQHPGMAHELYRTETVFREEVDRCAGLLLEHLGVDLREGLVQGPKSKVEGPKSKVEGPKSKAQSPMSNVQGPESEATDSRPSTLDSGSSTLDLGPSTLDSRSLTLDSVSPTLDLGPWTLDLSQTWLAQPALFVVEYAMARLWMSWGVRPKAMLGHSIGEYVAACLAGVFSLPEALALVAARGRLMQKLPEGAMAAVPLSPEDLSSRLGPELALAAVNRPSLCVVSGPGRVVEDFMQKLKQEGIFCKRLHTSHAFHSQMMDPILDEFRRLVEGTRRRSPQIPFLSNRSGSWISPAQAVDPDYWVEHLRHTVLFSQGLCELFRDPDTVLLEVGPGRTLGTIARVHPYKAGGQLILSSVGRLKDERSDQALMLKALARLWLAGVEVDWEGFNRGLQHRRVSLPGYPFQRRRYWVEPQASSSAARGPLGEGLENWFYVPRWKQTLPAASAQPQAFAGNWLLFLDPCGLGTRLTDELRSRAGTVVTVSAGDGFQRLEDSSFVLRPAERDDYTALFGALREEDRLPTRILHLWGLTQGRPDPQDCLEKGFFNLLHLAQAWGSRAGESQAELIAVADQACSVAGMEEVVPEKSAVLGLCRVIPLEYPRLSCRLLDVALPEPGSSLEKLLCLELLREIASGATDSPTAYRGQYRWVQAFEPLPLPEPADDGQLLRQKGVYWITGGLGGIGLEIADFLARHYQARLVLSGRRAVPNRSDWPGLPASDSLGKALCKVRELEEAGAEVLVLQADAADAQQMQAALEAVRRRFGQVQGVIHAAGVPSSGLIHLKARPDAESVLAPKLRGTRILWQLLQNDPLDFFVLCSSRAALLGGYGQADYASANAFLDAFAHSRAGRSHTRWLSINWNAWRETGMRHRLQAARSRQPEDDGADWQPFGHPLLQRRRVEPSGRTIFSSDFEPARHWVLDDHRILGKPVIPGVAYLEMARAALQERASGGVIELRDVYFLAPLAVEDGHTREVRFVVEPQGQGFRFSVISRADEGAEAPWQEFAMGSAFVLPASEPPRHDLQALRSRLAGPLITIDNRRVDENVGPRWQNLLRVQLGDDQLLAEYRLAPELASDLEDYHLHSGLLDRIAGSSIEHLARLPGYLPWSYKRVTIRGRFPQRLFCRAFYRGEGASQELTHDVQILDGQGRELVDIEGFTHRKAVNLAARSAAAAVRPTEEDQAEEIQGLTNQQGVEAFRRMLSGTWLPQVIVSPEDFPALLEKASRSASVERASQQFEEPSPSAGGHQRPELPTPFVEPRTELERRLAGLWQEVLGIGQVGIEDNFLELGGDSVQVIQMVARAGRLGLRLDPQMIFDHPSVAELAQALGGASPAQQPERLPLTPSQRHLVERCRGEVQGLSAVAVLEVKNGLNAEALEESLHSLVQAHQCLRLCFEKDEGEWMQAEHGLREGRLSTVLDAAALPQPQATILKHQLASLLAASLQPSEGQLLRAVLLKSGQGRPVHLLVALHRLAADRLSRTRLMAELEASCRRPSAERPAQAVPYSRWAAAMAERAQAPGLAEKAGFWLDEELPMQASAPLGQVNSSERSQATASLSDDETQALLQEVPTATPNRPLDLLLAALLQAFAEAAQRSSLWLELRLDGRRLVQDGVFEGCLGSCQAASPLLLVSGDTDQASQILKNVRARLRQLPGGGLSYGLLRYSGLHEETATRLAELPHPSVSFDYLEESESISEALLGWVRSDVFPPDVQGLQIRAGLREGRLALDWKASGVAASALERLAGTHIEALRGLIERCLSTKEEEFIPADFPLADLDEEALASVMSKLGD